MPIAHFGTQVTNKQEDRVPNHIEASASTSGVIHYNRTPPVPEPTGQEPSIGEAIAALSMDRGDRGTGE